MKLELGQVYRMVDQEPGATVRHVLVLCVRDDKHERGLGQGYGDSAQAWPIWDVPWPKVVRFSDLHPWDGWILCDALPHHGDTLWELVPGLRYVVDPTEGKALKL